MIYLDNNATTALLPEVAEAMSAVWQEPAGNPSSQHAPGRRASATLERCRERLGELLECRPTEIVFTSGGSESNNWALEAAYEAALAEHLTAPVNVVISTVEHPSTLQTARTLAERGCELRVVAVDGEGRVNPQAVVRAVDPQTAIVSIMLANNETGTMQPVMEIAETLRQTGYAGLIHTDLVQMVGKLPVSFRHLGVDLATVAAHKFHGPCGIGLLIVRHGVRLPAFIHGGAQQNERRAGTVPVALVVGMTRALEAAIQDLDQRGERMAALRDRLWASIRADIPDTVRNGSAEYCLPNTLNVSFLGADAQSVLMNLDLAGLAASSGSACASGAVGPSHVLAAMSVSDDRLKSAIRFSLSFLTTKTEIQQAGTIIAEAVAQVRRQTHVSP